MSVTSYRGYLIDNGNHVCSIVTIEAVDLASACAQAETVLGQTRFAAIEVWEGTSIVARRSAPLRSRLPWLSRKHPHEIAER
jgi:hypothetical protein